MDGRGVFVGRRASVSKAARAAAVATGCVVLATGFNLLLLHFVRVDRTPFMPFVLSVIAAATFEGMAGGVVALVLTTIVAAVFLPPYPSLAVTGTLDRVSLAMFVGVGAIVVVLCERIRRSRREVAATSDQLRQVLSQTHDSHFCLDRELRFTYVSPTVERELGRTAADLVGKSLRETYPRGVNSEVEQKYRDALEQQRAVEWEMPSKVYPGRWAEVRIYPSPGGLNVFIRDITERKVAEERLRAAEAQLRLITDALPAVVLYIDSEERYRFANAGYRKFRNRTAPDVVGKSVRDVLGDERYAEVRGLLAAARSGETVTFEKRLECGPELGDRDMFVTYVPDRRADGMVHGFVVLMTDETERKRLEADRARAETAARESERRFRLMADSAPVLVWVAEADKRCSWFNRNFVEFTGMSQAEGEGMKWLRAVHPDDIERCYRTFERAFDSRRPFTVEYRLRRRDGNFRWVLSQGVPVHAASGEFMGYVGSCVDIEGRKQAEEERQKLLEREQVAREEAVRANRAKDEFLAALSHELRTPLAPALLSLSALEGEAELSEELRGELAAIRRGVEVEARLIDDLLDVARIAQGKLTLSREVVDLHTLVEETVAMCGGGAVASGQVRVVVDLGARRRHVRGDRVRLRQVIWNLVSNAIKFTPAGGVVTVRAGDAGAGRIAVDVTDTGVGIEPAMIERIFRPFQQGGLGQGRNRGGLGLGLSIARTIVEAHGGALKAASDGPGRGSRFWFELDTVEVKETPSAEGGTGSGELAGRSLKILLVEDHAVTRAVMERLLHRMGHAPSTAEGVEEAVRAAGERKFDLVISDLGLPDGSGHELMRQIKSRYGIAGIALSGYGMEEDVRKSIEAGFSEHLTKPVDVRRLQAAIERAAAGGEKVEQLNS